MRKMHTGSAMRNAALKSASLPTAKRGAPAPKGEAKALANTARRQSTPTPAKAGPAQAEGRGEARGHERIVVVQMSVVGATDDARAKLFALRDVMHRVLNAA